MTISYPKTLKGVVYYYPQSRVEMFIEKMINRHKRMDSEFAINH